MSLGQPVVEPVHDSRETLLLDPAYITRVHCVSTLHDVQFTVVVISLTWLPTYVDMDRWGPLAKQSRDLHR